MMPPPPPRGQQRRLLRSEHEQLLDACEEGDLDTVKRCLLRPGVSAYLNQNGFARGIKRVLCETTGATLDWGHPELLACGRGDTALRFAAFHGYVEIVHALLEAGAIPSLRNDEAHSALALAKAGLKILNKRGTKGDKLILPEDKPRCGDPDQLAEVIRLLEHAERQQWVIVNVTDRPYLNGRIGQRVRVMEDRVLVIVDDSEPGPHRPYFEKGAVRSARLLPSQLRRLKPPPPPLREWPLGQRWAWPLPSAVGVSAAGPSSAR